MGTGIALDELLATGWCGLDSSGCAFDDRGRAYPTVPRVHTEFSNSGFDLAITHVAKFDCYRAEWREGGGAMAGSVIAQSQEEAAVYALAQLRRSLAAA